MMNDDMGLVREFARGSERAFETLVSRHVDLVYSSALRQARNPHLAEEITQAVFIILARKAGSLGRRTILPGWLYRTTRFTAANALRAESSRQHREQEVYMQSTTEDPSTETAWLELSPLLDEAMAQLGSTDRDALLLRYFQNKSLQEVGASLGVEERAAQKRVARGLEKLRVLLTKRGVTLSATAIAGAVTVNSVQAAPAALTGSVMAAAKGTAAATSTLTLVKGALKIMVWTKAKAVIVVGAGILLAAGTTTVVKRTVSTRDWDIYEKILQEPNSNSTGKLEKAPPTLLVRPTQYPNGGSGIWTGSGKGVFVNASFNDLVAWSYNTGTTRMIFPDDLPKEHFDYLNTLPHNQFDALRVEMEKRFKITAHHENRLTDVLVLKIADPARLKTHLSKGKRTENYGDGEGKIQKRFFTNQPLSTIAEEAEGYFAQPTVDQTGSSKHYDFVFQWTEKHWISDRERMEGIRAAWTAQLENVGLQLVPGQAVIDILVVERTK